MYLALSFSTGGARFRREQGWIFQQGAHSVHQQSRIDLGLDGACFICLLRPSCGLGAVKQDVQCNTALAHSTKLAS